MIEHSFLLKRLASLLLILSQLIPLTCQTQFRAERVRAQCAVETHSGYSGYPYWITSTSATRSSKLWIELSSARLSSMRS